MGLGIKEIIGDKREAILAAAAKYGIENVRIFGSVARGDAKLDSDIDLLVDLRKSGYFQMFDFMHEMESVLSRKIDVVSDRGLDKYIGPYIIKEAKPL